MGRSHQLGKDGEEKAVAYLLQNGYRIMERNWRFHHYEVDIICSRDGLLVVVEVKSRTVGGGGPDDLLDFRKRENLRKAADAYVRMKGLRMEVRFDLILLEGPDFGLVHIPDAVQIFE